MEDENNDLFAIDLSSSDESASTSNKPDPKPPRDFQSEAAFQVLKASYKVKIEKGDLWRTLTLPVDNPSKSESQTILHAIEELYFLGKFVEAREVTERALGGELMDEFRVTLEGYATRCESRIEKLEKKETGC